MAKKEYIEVGIVNELYRYPVKAFAGETVPESWVGWHGLEGDRRFAFLKLDSKRGFPWLTARDNPSLLQFQPHFVEVDNSQAATICVRTPDGDELPLDSWELLKRIRQLSRSDIHLIQNWSGIFDAMDISLLSLASIAAVSEAVEIPFEPERFRPNILVEAFDDRPFLEDRWVKSLLVFGDQSNAARLRVNRKTLRCMVINVDAKTGKQNPSVLKHVVQNRKNLLGVYSTTERPGMIRVGDVIRLLKE